LDSRTVESYCIVTLAASTSTRAEQPAPSELIGVTTNGDSMFRHPPEMVPFTEIAARLLTTDDFLVKHVTDWAGDPAGW
jgi:hypothetical protein